LATGVSAEPLIRHFWGDRRRPHTRGQRCNQVVGGQCGVVDDAAAGDVGQLCAGLDSSELLGTHHMVVGGRTTSPMPDLLGHDLNVPTHQRHLPP
jgi:hypothetical protein